MTGTVGDGGSEGAPQQESERAIEQGSRGAWEHRSTAAPQQGSAGAPEQGNHMSPHLPVPASGRPRVRASSSPSIPASPHLPSTDPFIRGSEYLSGLRQLALEPGAIDIMDDINDRIRICTWIGQNIDRINAELNTCLEACQSCFHPEERRVVQIKAAPLAEKLGVDGFCNILANPIAILIDVGRIEPQDWLSVVAHEYAHAHLGIPGHDQRFLEAISHMCLGLGLEPPVWESGTDEREREIWLRNWPPSASRPDPLAFWRGGA